MIYTKQAKPRKTKKPWGKTKNNKKQDSRNFADASWVSYVNLVFFVFFVLFPRFYCLFLVLLGSLNKLIYIILQNTQKPWFSPCVTLWLFGCLRVNCCTSADLLDNSVFLILENGQKTPNPKSKYTHIVLRFGVWCFWAVF